MHSWIMAHRGEEATAPSAASGAGRISVDDMDLLIAAGEAQPLLPEFDVGPTWYERMWWVVPQGVAETEGGYLVADDSAQVELTAQCVVLQTSAEMVAAFAEERRAHEARQRDDDPAAPYERPRQQGRRGRWRRR